MTVQRSVNMREASAILKGIVVPIQPCLVSKVQSAGSDLNEIGDIISQDPGLSAGIMKLVNSPLYSSAKQRYSSIHDAVDELGKDSIINIINAVLLKMASNQDFHRMELQDFWESSREVAYACAMAARQLNIGMVDEAYCLGLFHNIGMPLIYQKYGDYFRYLRDVEDGNLIKWENEKYKCDHAIVGFYIAKGMGMSNQICLAIRDHHDPYIFSNSKNIDDQILMLIALLKFGEFVTKESQRLTGLSDYSEWEVVKSGVIEIIGLSEPDFLDLSEILLEQVLHRND